MTTQIFGFSESEYRDLLTWQGSLHGDRVFGLKINTSGQLECTKTLMTKRSFCAFLGTKESDFALLLRHRNVCVEQHDPDNPVAQVVAKALVQLSHFLKLEGISSQFIGPKYKKERLYDAIQNNNMGDVRFWIEMSHPRLLFTDMIYAIVCEKLDILPEIVEMLLPTSNSLSGVPIEKALECGHVVFYRHCIRLGVEPRMKWLQAAASSGCMEMVKDLIEVRGIVVYSHSLYAALSHGHYDMALYLREKGGVLSVAEGERLLTLGCEEGNVDKICVLTSIFEVKAGREHLKMAISHDHPAAVQFLINSRIEVMLLDLVTAGERTFSLLTAHLEKEGIKEVKEPILLQAVQRGSKQAIEFLLRHGVNVSFQDQNGLNALMIAATCHYELIPMLLAEGADPFALNKKKRSLLHMAGDALCMDAFKVVLDSLPRPESLSLLSFLDYRGDTAYTLALSRMCEVDPLHFMVYYRPTLLLFKSFDVDLNPKYVLSMHQRGDYTTRFILFEALLELDASIEGLVDMAIRHFPEAISSLVKKGVVLSDEQKSKITVQLLESIEKQRILDDYELV